MKKRTFLIIYCFTAILTYSCNVEPYWVPSPINVLIVKSETGENLLGNNRTYHPDSVVVYTTNGNVSNYYCDSSGSFDWSIYIDFVANYDWDGINEIYGGKMDTTFYLYLNQYETDTIDIDLWTEDTRGRFSMETYFNGILAEQPGDYGFLLKKDR